MKETTKQQTRKEKAIADMQQVARTEMCINQTYGPKQPTKARRKLPGKRKWKNKEAQYSKLKTKLLVKKMNARFALNK